MIKCPHCGNDFDPSYTEYCPDCGAYPEDRKEELTEEDEE